MTVNEPKHLFAKLHALVFDTNGSTNTEFIASLQKSKRKHFILVLDELDNLVTLDGDVLYQLFELVHIKNSKISIVGIANALDLTDRFLPRLKIKGCKIL
jgi:cell division control protein 6